MQLDFDKEEILANLKNLRHRLDQSPVEMYTDDLRDELIDGIRAANKDNLQLAFNIQKDTVREFANRTRSFEDLNQMVNDTRVEFGALAGLQAQDMTTFLDRVVQLISKNEYDEATEVLVLAQTLGRSPDKGMDQTLNALQNMDKRLLREPDEVNIDTARSLYKAAVDLFGQERYFGAMLKLEEAKIALEDARKTLRTTRRKVRVIRSLIEQMRDLGYLMPDMFPAMELDQADIALSRGDLTGAWVLTDDMVDSLEDGLVHKVEEYKPFLKSGFNALVNEVNQRKSKGENVEISKRAVFKFHKGVSEAQTFRQVAMLAELLEQTKDDVLGTGTESPEDSWERSVEREKELLQKDIEAAQSKGVDASDPSSIIEDLEDKMPGCGEEMAMRYISSARNALVRAIHRYDKESAEVERLENMLSKPQEDMELLEDDLDVSMAKDGIDQARQLIEKGKFTEAEKVIESLSDVIDDIQDQSPSMEFELRVDGVPDEGDWFEATVVLKNRGGAKAGNINLVVEAANDSEVLTQPFDKLKYFPYSAQTKLPIQMKVVTIGAAGDAASEGDPVDVQLRAKLEFNRVYDDAPMHDLYPCWIKVAKKEDFPPPPDDALMDDRVVDALKKLGDLKASGILTEEEFQQKKQELLKRL